MITLVRKLRQREKLSEFILVLNFDRAIPFGSSSRSANRTRRIALCDSLRPLDWDGAISQVAAACLMELSPCSGDVNDVRAFLCRSPLRRPFLPFLSFPASRERNCPNSEPDRPCSGLNPLIVIRMTDTGRDGHDLP
jgi:hypothetical protein